MGQAAARLDEPFLEPRFFNDEAGSHRTRPHTHSAPGGLRHGPRAHFHTQLRTDTQVALLLERRAKVAKAARDAANMDDGSKALRVTEPMDVTRRPSSFRIHRRHSMHK